MIEPAKGTSKYKIGAALEDIDFSIFDKVEIEDRDILKVYKTKSIWFFFNKKTNMLDQLSLFSPFNEKTKENIGIGNTLSDIYAQYGECVKNHKVYEPKRIPGIAFEMKNGNEDKMLKIGCISVSEPYAFYGKL